MRHYITKTGGCNSTCWTSVVEGYENGPTHPGPQIRSRKTPDHVHAGRRFCGDAKKPDGKTRHSARGSFYTPPRTPFSTILESALNTHSRSAPSKPPTTQPSRTKIRPTSYYSTARPRKHDRPHTTATNRSTNRLCKPSCTADPDFLPGFGRATLCNQG